jgi:plastocyanin
MGQIRRLTVVLGVAAIAAALPAGASALTKTVYAGPPPSARSDAVKVLGQKFVKTYSPDVDAFFLNKVTVNQGDTVSFNIEGFHTIDLPGASGEDLPLFTTGATISGVKDAAGKPFWFNGREPSVGFNSALFMPSGPTTYDGTTRIDTGLPLGSGPPRPLNVTFTKPGTYKYFCDVHPGMVGEVVVKPNGQSVPSAAQDAASLNNEIKRDLAALGRAAKVRVPADHVSVGGSGGNGAELLAMLPSKLTVKRGTVVTFAMPLGSREIHTATFGPANYINALSTNLFVSPGPTQEGVYPSSPTQPIPLGPNSHGNGFANIGLIDRDPATTVIPPSGKIKFTKPGVYHFICLIHNNMHGTIVVTNQRPPGPGLG